MTLNRRQKDNLIVGIEGFLAASSLPERQELMAQLGLSESLLSRGQQLTREWQARRRIMDETRAESERMVKRKKTLKQTARLEMSGLTMVIRRHFYNNEEVLRVLGLNTKYKSKPEAPETDAPPDVKDAAPAKRIREAVGLPREERVLVQHWRDVLDCIPHLEPDVLEVIELFGYDEARREELRQAVEAFAEVIPLREMATEERRERIRLFNRVERELLTWIFALRATLASKIRLLRREGQDEFLALMAV